MPTEHFTRDDLIGVAIGTLLFAVLLLPPGYTLGWLSDLLDFRQRSWPEQLVTSLVLSVSMVPILDYFLWAQLSIYAVWAFYLACGIFFVLFSLRAHNATVPRWIIVAAALWLILVWFSGVDLQFGNRLFPSVLSYDFTLRTAVVSGLARNGLPAQSSLLPTSCAAASVSLLLADFLRPNRPARRQMGQRAPGSGLRERRVVRLGLNGDPCTLCAILSSRR